VSWAAQVVTDLDGIPSPASVSFLAVEAPRRDPTLAIDLAYLAGAIERWAGDLALAEEPSRFLVALESLGCAPTPAESSR
jgi:hypothetical protein